MSRYSKARPAPTPNLMPREDRIAQKQAEFLAEAAPDAGAIYPKRAPITSRTAIPAEAHFLEWQAPVQPDNPRSLRVGILGAPNAGKSSFVNAVMGSAFVAVSPKVNTTRKDVRCVWTEGNTQIVFTDAPGIIPHNQSKQCKDLVNVAWTGYNDCDVVLLVVDCVKRPTIEEFNLVRKIAPFPSLGEEYHKVSKRASLMPDRMLSDEALNEEEATLERNGHLPPVILALNKIDKSDHPKWIQKRAVDYESNGKFKGVHFISALTGRGMQRLLLQLQSLAQDRPWVYPNDTGAMLSKTHQVEELVRTYLFCWFNKDVPYKLEQQVVGWTPKLDGSLTIEHEIICEDSVVARMILGVRNRLLVRLRENVQFKLEERWGIKVNLYIWVKAQKVRKSKKDIADEKDVLFAKVGEANGYISSRKLAIN